MWKSYKIKLQIGFNIVLISFFDVDKLSFHSNKPSYFHEKGNYI